MERPSVDVVVPFAGTPAALAAALDALAVLARRDGDTLTLVDNRPAGAPAAAPPDGVRIVAALERRSSYHARNRGAAGGSAPWLVFLDADVRPEPGLLDAYFDPPVAEDVAILAGAIADAGADAAAPLAARFAAARKPMAQEVTTGRAERPYAQTANCAVRRAAFHAVGGFADDVRSGGDADLCFRLRAAGWHLESRPGARVVHSNRESLRALLRQRARHGAGAAWLDRRYPGSFPQVGARGLAASSTRAAAAGLRDYRRGEREAARFAAVEIAASWAFALGRRMSNARP